MDKQNCKITEYSFLQDNDLYQIHENTLDVLEKVGCVILSEDAKTLFKKAGCKVNGDIVNIPSFLVEEAIKTAPMNINIFNKYGEMCMELKNKNIYFGTGPTTPFTLDIYSGERRKTVRDDIILHSKVAESLGNIDFVMPLGSVSDFPKEYSDIIEFESTIKYTKKPIPCVSWNKENFKTIVEISKEFSGGTGDFINKPFIIHFCQPISPLKYDESTLENIIYTAEIGLPLSIYSAITMGGTGPMDIYGSIVQGNAEILTALLLTQLKNEGTPFIMGISVMPLNMSNGLIIYGSPEYYLAMSVYTQLCQNYQIPTWGTGGLTDSKCIDEQAAIESTLCTFMAALSGNNLIHDCGYMDSCMTGSAEMIVMQNEIIGSVKRITRGVQLRDKDSITNLIKTTGLKGNYLNSEHTLRNFKDIWTSDLFDRKNYNQWKDEGEITLREKINKKTKRIVEEYRKEDNHMIEKNIDKIISDNVSN